jgi:hypothetical protein
MVRGPGGALLGRSDPLVAGRLQADRGMIPEGGLLSVDLNTWTPMRWPCGPLEIDRGEKRDDFTKRERTALEAWADPGQLEWLEGTPVDCLVVTWAGGSFLDEPQQQSLAPLIAAARERKLALVGHVGEGADLRRAAAAAASAGLAALATESDETVEGLPVLRFGAQSLEGRSPGEFLGVSGGVWPGLRVNRQEDFDAWSGVTGPPWVDSNAWFVRLARELVNPGAVWLDFDPPVTRMAAPAGAYVQAIADAEIYGGRWVISLDPRLRYELSRGRGQDTWGQVGQALTFFRSHRVWTSYRPVSRLGVVSDFAGDNAFLSFEVANLLTRQSSAYRLLRSDEAMSDDLDELKALLYVDRTPPKKELRQRLYSFVEDGGTLITPPGWEERGERWTGAVFPRFHVCRFGRGRLAVAREDLSDPHLLASDAQVLLSHRHDPVRVFNLGTSRFHFATSDDGASGVLHLFRYARRPFEDQVSVWFDRPWGSAGTWLVGSDAAEPTGRTPKEPGVEFQLPRVGPYCAVEVSG